MKPTRALQGAVLRALHNTLSTCDMLQSIDLPPNAANSVDALPNEAKEATKKSISFQRGTQLRKKKIQRKVHDDSGTEDDDLFVDLVDEWPSDKKTKYAYNSK